MAPVGLPNHDTALLKGGVTVAELSKPADFDGNEITFNELLVKGDLSGELTYRGKTVVIDSINEIIGLEITQHGARGPVWKGVHLKVVA